MKSVRLYAYEPASRANGPGLRAVLWFQGCSLGCPGCFNPGTHDPNHGPVTDTAAIAATLANRANAIEGVSISGGEPFQQPDALLDLLTRIEGLGLSRLVFSGYTLTEIQRQPLGPAILAHLDVVIAGRFVQSQPHGKGLIGSANQRIHMLTNRHSIQDFAAIPTAEAILHTDGTITLTGIHPLESRPSS